MRPLTIPQYQAALEVQRVLVERGYHPATAGRIVRRAVTETPPGLDGCCGSCASGGSCDGGLGVQQMRSLRRDLDPTIAPRPVVAGEQCVRIQEIPGNETVMYRQIEDYRNRGWNVMEISRTKGFPSVAVYWACPPGRVPMESQGQVLAAQFGDAPPAILTDLTKAADDPLVAAFRNAISPWLWVTSLIGFGMGLLNTRRIATMYRKHVQRRKS